LKPFVGKHFTIHPFFFRNFLQKIAKIAETQDWLDKKIANKATKNTI